MVSEKLAYARSTPQLFWKLNYYHLYNFPQKKNLAAQGTEAKSSQPNPMTVFESLIGEEKVKKFEQRFEKYDLESDELYSVWLKMKTLTIHDKPSVTDTTLSSTDTFRSTCCTI